jgi:hypothetical protein
MKNTIDLRYLNWSKSRDSSGTAGSYLKSYSYSNGKKVYYKLPFFDDVNGLFGYEAINEIIASRVLDELGYNHLKYELLNGIIIISGKEYNTYLNSSVDFKGANESKITLENFYELNKEDNECLFDLLDRYNLLNEVYEAIIVDFLIINRDRHGANIEILYNSRDKKYKIAPLYDHGLSFLSPFYLDKDIENYDINIERRVNSYLGTSSLFENIKMVPINKLPKAELNYDYIFGGLDDINPTYLEKCKEILVKGMKYIENLRNKK